MARAPIHPGEILADELQEIGVTPTELSRQIDVPANRIAQIIHGQRGVTGDTALRLGHWFGPPERLRRSSGSTFRVPITSASPRKRPVARSRGCRCAPTSKVRRDRADQPNRLGRSEYSEHGQALGIGDVGLRCANPTYGARLAEQRRCIPALPPGWRRGQETGSGPCRAVDIAVLDAILGAYAATLAICSSSAPSFLCACSRS